MFPLELYSAQSSTWPKVGRHILAHFDDESIVVYQAYNPTIGRFAVEHGKFGGSFSFSRMSWIKPNFLWMMYRSGWGTKENQEITLRIRLPRGFFDSLLQRAVPSSWDRDLFASEEEWASAVAQSSVRLQWDPDHHPSGAKLERRAIQLGMRGRVLEEFAMIPLEIADISDFVSEQRERFQSRGIAELRTPTERIYRPVNPEIASRLRLDDFDSEHAPESP